MSFRSGDTLTYSGDKKRLDGLKRYNKGSTVAQLETIRMLATDSNDKVDDGLQFKWTMPAHRRMLRFQSKEEKDLAILKAAENFEQEDETDDMLLIGYP